MYKLYVTPLYIEQTPFLFQFLHLWIEGDEKWCEEKGGEKQSSEEDGFATSEDIASVRLSVEHSPLLRTSTVHKFFANFKLYKIPKKCLDTFPKMYIDAIHFRILFEHVNKSFEQIMLKINTLTSIDRLIN